MRHVTPHVLRRGALLTAMLVGLIGPQLAFGDEAHERALEARVADLERMVNQLVAQQKAQMAAAPAPAPRPAAAPGARPIQETTLTPGAASPDTTVKFGGFIMTDFLATRTSGGTLADSAVSRDLYQPAAIPVGGKASSTLYDAHAKFSRFNVGIDSKNDAGDKYGAFFEWDFEGNALGSEVTTNLQGATLRHGYVYWNDWLAGQTWTNFMDPAALPEAVDFIGPTDGTVFVRQAQIRYTNGGFSFAAENPENTFVDVKGVVTAYDRNTVPDFTARYTWKGDWGFFGIAGILRQLRYEATAAPLVKQSDSGGGISAMGRWNIGKNDDLRYAITAGNGVARYIGLGVAADAEVDALGDIDTRNGYAGYVAWRHALTSQLRFNLMYAGNHFDNDTEFGLATKSTDSFHINLIYSPLPKLDVGAELIYGKRELENGADDDLKRIQAMVKYSF
jgi:hypothetical protein